MPLGMPEQRVVRACYRPRCCTQARGVEPAVSKRLLAPMRPGCMRMIARCRSSAAARHAALFGPRASWPPALHFFVPFATSRPGVTCSITINYTARCSVAQRHKRAAHRVHSKGSCSACKKNQCVVCMFCLRACVWRECRKRFYRLRCMTRAHTSSSGI